MTDALRSRAAPLRMRPRQLVTPDPLLPSDVAPGATAVVVGGGIAGMVGHHPPVKINRACSPCRLIWA